MKEEKYALLLHPSDTVAVVLNAVEPGDPVTPRGEGQYARPVTSLCAIPMYHKIALCDIPVNAPVYKYGEIIGTASKKITRGMHVHVDALKGVKTYED